MRADMDAVVLGLKTKSDKIRALDNAGYERREIADYLGVKYQFVWNVIAADKRSQDAAKAVAATPGLSDPARSFVHREDVDVGRAVRIDVGADGAMILPPALLKAVGLTQGGFLLARFDDDEIKLLTPETTTRKIQAEVRKYVPEGVSLVDELIKERRREVAREGDA